MRIVEKRRMMQSAENKRFSRIGPAVLMVTSVIGPGFLTQIPQYTAHYLGSLAFVIAGVFVLDLVVQMNIWSVIGASNKRAPEIVNEIYPGLGYGLIVLITLGGLCFNIGNIGGAAMGLGSLLGLDERIAAALCGLFGISIFLSRSGTRVVDIASKILAAAIFAIMIGVCFMAVPPMKEAVTGLLHPEEPVSLVAPLLVILGGACGGYIPFSGSHRLLEKGAGGQPLVFRKAAVTGVCMTAFARILLFLCVMGACYTGGKLLKGNAESIMASSNPAAKVFEIIMGEAGHIIFSFAILFAGTATMIAAAYTSVTFLQYVHPFIATHQKWFIAGFIASSTAVIAGLGGAKRMVLLAGAVNGFVLPFSLGCILLACRRKEIVGDYRHPVLLEVFGWFVVVVSLASAVGTIPNIVSIFA